MPAPYRVARARTTRLFAKLATFAVAFGCASAFVALDEQSAHASGFIYTKFGGDYGSAALGSPYSVYFNPAAIGETHGTNVVVDGMFAYRYAKYDRPASALSPGPGKTGTDPVYVAANTGTAKATGFQGAPYLGVTTDFGGKLPIFAGFASYIPEGGISSFGHRSSWQNDPRAPGAYDGPQRWALVSGTQISWWNTVAFGATIPSIRLSFAVSASIVRDSLTSLLARNRDASDDLSTPSGVPTEGRSLLDVSGTHLAIGAGLFWVPMENGKLRFGVSYMSGQGLGDSRLKGTLKTQFGAGTSETQDADMLQHYPDVLRFGGAYRASKDIDLRLDVEWVRWSVFKRQCIVLSGADCNIADDGSEIVPAGSQTKVLLDLQRFWQDAVMVRAGVGWFLSDTTELMGSFGIDTSAVPARHLDATYFDAFKILVSLGIRQHLTETFFLGATLQEMYLFSVDNTDSAISYRYAIPSRSPSTGGKYDSSLTFLDLNVGARF